MEIQGFSNYLIFKNGAILSKGYDKFHPPRFLKKHISTSGYYCVNMIDDDGKKRFVSHHRLMGLHFIPNPENKPTLDHIDRNKLNNDISNLRWATRREQNLNQSIRKDNKTGYTGISWDKSRNRYVARKVGHIAKRFKTIEEAIEYRIS
jgi:hypothetical protein